MYELLMSYSTCSLWYYVFEVQCGFLHLQHISQQLHVECSVATCGYWLPYWAA